MKGLVVLSGPSGSGKSTAVKALEDLGFFCVDNMPVSLLPKFMELLTESVEIERSAVVVDVRERGFLKHFTPVYAALKDAGYKIELMYLEAGDDALVRRFSETRRKHPLAGEESPLEGILKERELLKGVKAQADMVLDTTAYNVHQLRDAVRQHYSGQSSAGKMTVNLLSFGYRYGIPSDADLVIDIRFLPNPYFINTLKWLDGTADEVKKYVLQCAEAKEFLEKLTDFITYLLPLYAKEGKAYLTLAIGCTGGRHRSVVIVDAIAGALGKAGVVMRARHRDVNKT